MNRTAPPAGKAARQAAAAADRLLDWLRTQRGSVPQQAEDDAPHGIAPSLVAAPPANPDVEGAPVAIQAAPRPDCGRPPGAGAPLRLPHPDWLHHRLAVTGPVATVADFQAAARGAGVIPWRLDLDRLEEDLLHLLVAPPAPQRRRLSLAGARALASQLREAVERRQSAVLARLGSSRGGAEAASQACPLDLHALVPVPPGILRLGPDDPEALAWLWAQWGTTDALRHVAAEPPPALRAPLPSGTAAVRYSFWSADWTPWRALAAVAVRWPVLRLDIRPTYGPP